MKILTASYVLTMNVQNECIKNGAILIGGDQIKAVGTLAQLTQCYPEVFIEHYPQALLMPGLINTHCHFVIPVYCAVRLKDYRFGIGYSSILTRCTGC